MSSQPGSEVHAPYDRYRSDPESIDEYMMQIPEELLEDEKERTPFIMGVLISLVILFLIGCVSLGFIL